MSTGNPNFYDKVAVKYGGYKSVVKIVRECPGGDPEQVFKQKLLEYSGENIVALDTGCADGSNTLALAPAFRKIVAIDLSRGMLEVASTNLRKLKINNVDFELIDSSKTGFADERFDVIYSRRGPTDYNEYFRILKTSGVYLEIQIGENDARQLKETFGRGQDYGEWTTPKLDRNIKELEKHGFEIIFAQDYVYSEYYSSYGDLERFLQSVPIFEDFDESGDKPLLWGYVNKNTSSKGVSLPRHRILIVALKPSTSGVED